MADTLNARTSSFVTTLIAVATPDREGDTAGVLARVREQSAVRTILITLGADRQPAVRRDGDAVVIERLVPEYVNNAVASLRLSSLPSVAWWRGEPGAGRVVGDLADLVDRLILDSTDPAADWAHAVPLMERTAVSDLRWAALTRWRSLLAQFFDVAQVREAAGTFTHVAIEGGDDGSARLLGAWLAPVIGMNVAVSISASPGPALRAVALTAPGCELRLRRLDGHGCIETSIRTDGHDTTRVVASGGESTVALLLQDLRVRARDEAFESALRAVAGGERKS